MLGLDNLLPLKVIMQLNLRERKSKHHLHLKQSCVVENCQFFSIHLKFYAKIEEFNFSENIYK